MIYHPLPVSMTTTLTGITNMTYPLLILSAIYVVAIYIYGRTLSDATLISNLMLVTSNKPLLLECDECYQQCCCSDMCLPALIT